MSAAGAIDTTGSDQTRLVMALLAVDPQGLGGVVLDHPTHAFASDFARGVHAMLPTGVPQQRIPIGVSADRLLGGVDLTATLSAGRLIAERGVLASADGGVVVLPMSERLSLPVRTVLSSVLDTGQVHVERDGIAARHSARVVCVLIDESLDDESVHPSLLDRVAFLLPPAVNAREARGRDVFGEDAELTAHARAIRSRVRDASHRVREVSTEERWVIALCETADAFGITSPRVVLYALRCARAHAALGGRLSVTEADAETAARLVLAPRASRIPVAPSDEEHANETPSEPQDAERESRRPDEGDTDRDAPRDEHESSETQSDEGSEGEQELLPDADTDILRAAVAAAIPPGLLTALIARADAGNVGGREGEEQESALRGRPRGVRTGMPRGGARLHLLETLRAAAPWQRVRTGVGKALKRSPSLASGRRLEIRREDLRVRRFAERTGTTVLFVVDASGSSAISRLAEAKGAIELLLAESYARRDRVSLIAFRGSGTEVLLPPTRALARAKHVLGGMPGGGGTPMAAAIEAAMQQALLARRAGSAPLVVMLTDGRANIARDGTPGRALAERDALENARAFAAAGIPALFVDTSMRGEPVARRIADSMRARYILLPSADASAVGALVRSAIDGTL